MANWLRFAGPIMQRNAIMQQQEGTRNRLGTAERSPPRLNGGSPSCLPILGADMRGASSPPVLLRFGMILAAYYRTLGQIGNTAGSDSRMNPGLGGS